MCGLTEQAESSHYRMLPHWEKAKAAARAAVARGDDLIVTIMLGTNDADTLDYGYTLRGEAFENAYRAKFHKEYFFLIDTLRAIAPMAKFVFVRSPYSYDSMKHAAFGNLPAVWNWQDEVFAQAKKNKIFSTVLDMGAATSPSVMSSETLLKVYFQDRLHPNDVGYLYFAHFFYNAIMLLAENQER